MVVSDLENRIEGLSSCQNGVWQCRNLHHLWRRPSVVAVILLTNWNIMLNLWQR